MGLYARQVIQMMEANPDEPFEVGELAHAIDPRRTRKYASTCKTVRRILEDLVFYRVVACTPPRVSGSKAVYRWTAHKRGRNATISVNELVAEVDYE